MNSKSYFLRRPHSSRPSEAGRVWGLFGGFQPRLAGFIGLLGIMGMLHSQEATVQRVTVTRPAPTTLWVTNQPGADLSSNGFSLLSAALPGAEGDWLSAFDEGAGRTVGVSSRLAIKVRPGISLPDLIRFSGLKVERQVDETLAVLAAADVSAAIRVAGTLSVLPGVEACYPLTRRVVRRKEAYATAPDDPRFAEQWHLENRDAQRKRSGPDLNVRAAWAYTRGGSVVVAVGDDGFQLDHPELRLRAEGQPHYNFFSGNANGGPASGSALHATAVAGLIAAESDNHRGVSGVAPQASLLSMVIFGTSILGSDSIATEDRLFDMFQYASNRVAVQNHSWGSDTPALTGIDALSDAGIENAVSKGRNGKGVVIVRAAGNERENLTNANDDGFASDPRVISVAAVRRDGRACSYSSPGACLLVAAPSGDLLDTDGDGQGDSEDPLAPDVLTTDRTGILGYNSATDESGDYTLFNGTSASSPQIAGVAALILASNPALAVRDVQQILIQSARHFDAADPDLRPNGAGFVFSQNDGFGVPDAGFAVQLAKGWTNRPAVVTASITNTVRADIPDDALRVECQDDGLPEALKSLRTLPTLGLHADEPTEALGLVFVGLATNAITTDLHGKGALIQRGTSFFSDKIRRAADAGAAFAVIYNNVGTTEIQPMGGTTFVPIPAVSISKQSGEALRDYVAAHPSLRARIRLTPAVYRFEVHPTLLCEHVGVRLKTTHTSRADLRITLISPLGTRSVLQAINIDSNGGPKDWTYWTTRNFFEPSVGTWSLEVSDERATTVRSGRTSVPATGSVTYAELRIRGVGIEDTDGDGLDDRWERAWFGDLRQGPRDDPDGDGFSNAREQLLGTNPVSLMSEFRVAAQPLEDGWLRLSWPSGAGDIFQLLGQTNVVGFRKDLVGLTVVGGLPVAEAVVPERGEASRFFQVKRFAPSR